MHRPTAIALLPLVLCADLSVVGLGAAPARAAETDPYYAWLYPPRDSTAALNRTLQRTLEAAVHDVNLSLGREHWSCLEATRRIRYAFLRTGMWFFLGSLEREGLDFVPRSNAEYRERYRPLSIYRYSYFAKWGFAVPVDPTLRVADVYLSPDKLGHFFNDGYDYYRRYRTLRDEGATEDAAHEGAIDLGIRDESWIQGDVISGIFSYADLEANEQGFVFYRDLCEGESPGLVLQDGRWRLTRPFELQRYVNPCWDESYYVSAFVDDVGRGVARALQETYCARRPHPEVQRLRHRYDQLGCTSFSHRYLERLVAAGTIPDRSSFTLEVLCEGRAP